MGDVVFRRMAERLGRNRVFKRRLPAQHGRRPIWVSPDARLRYLKPGTAGFDAGLLEFIERVVRKNDIVLDIGANVGEFSLAAANKSGKNGSVLAVEPDPFLASLITKTSQENQNQELGIGILCSAVSKDAGMSRFYVSDHGRASNALAQCGSEDMGGMRYECFVPTVPIDVIVDSWLVPDLIKIDVEGAELSVLEGGINTFKSHRPFLFIETRKDKETIQKLFKDIGYLSFDPADRNLTKPITELTFDTFAVAEERVEELRTYIKSS